MEYFTVNKQIMILVSLLLAIVSPSCSQTSLYYNGHIFTSQSTNPFVGYFIIEKGIITETGSFVSADRIAQFDTKFDLQGKTVIPGFVDSHIHFIDGALGLLQVSLSDVQTPDELVIKIKSTSSQVVDGIYVARDLGFPALTGIRSPLAYLDTLIPDLPAILFLKSGHAAIANTLALKRLGFNEHSKIQDGIIGKDTVGNLDGWLLEAAAMEALKRIGAQYSGQTIEKAIQKAQELALSYGITTLGDNTFSPYHMKIYQTLQRAGKLNIRIWTRSYGRIPQTTSLMKPMGVQKLGFIGPANDYDQIHYHATKLFEDMSLSVPSGVTGSIEPGGTIYLNTNEVKNYFLLRPDDTFAFHVQGETGLQNIIDAIEELGKRNNSRRHVIDHAGYCTPLQLTILKNAGEAVTILAPQTFDYPAILRAYRKSKIELRENELLDARLKYQVLDGALSSDFPYGMDTSFMLYKHIDGLNPFPNIAVNVTGRFPDGSYVSGFLNKTLTTEEAIQSYTANGAFVLGNEKTVGKIAPGYVADFCILDRNVFSAATMDLYNCKVDQTYSGGKKVYDRFNAVTPDTLTLERRIKPYDYTISPVFGYDPTIGFIFGAAGFLYPLKTPASYCDLQVMATAPGNIHLQSTYIRYSILKSTDFKFPVTFSTFPQYYFGEGNTTSGDEYVIVSSHQIFSRPELSLALPAHFNTRLFVDYRYRKENAVHSKNNDPIDHRLFPDEQNLGIGLSFHCDTRDNPNATKLGFYGSIFYEHVSDLQSATSHADLLWGDFRYFHYIYSSRFVLAARLSAGTNYGNPGYMTRYTLGGAEKLRGYYTNRFRGNHFYTAQLEFRFPLFGRFSGVCFVDEGDISDSKPDDILISYGAGIRFSINDNVALRLDYGLGKDQQGVFFTFGEAF